MIVLCVDPGNVLTATVLLDLESEKILGRWYLPNTETRQLVTNLALGAPIDDYSQVTSPNPKKILVCDLAIRKQLGIDDETYPTPTFMVMEMVGSYSQAVGQTTFETCCWIGIFIQAFAAISKLISGGERNYTLLKRQAVRTNLCQTSLAGDPQVRAALVDRIGDKGTKSDPGPMFGMKADLYSALAVGLTFKDLKAEYIALMNSPKAEAILRGNIKIKPVWVLLEADGGDVTLLGPKDDDNEE